MLWQEFIPFPFASNKSISPFQRFDPFLPINANNQLQVCNSFRLNLSPIDINYLPKSSQKSYETWVKGPKPLDLWYGGMPCGPGSRSKSHGLRTLIRIQGSGR